MIHNYMVLIEGMLDTINTNLEECIQLQEFKDLSVKILEQFEDSH